MDIKRAAALLLIPICFALMLPGCASPDGSGQGERGDENPGAFSSLEEIPGITEHEILAIRALQSRDEPFIYGMPLNTETYENENGEIRGFSYLFCQWLAELTDLPIEIALYDWEDLVNDLGSIQEPGSAKVSFTGEMTFTEARREIYHMTAPIASRPLKAFRIAGSVPLEEIAETRLPRCGFMRGASTIGVVTSELEPGTYELIELDSYSEVYNALKKSDIDVFYYSAPAEFHFLEYPDVVALDFYPLSFMPVSLTTADPHLRPVISVVDKALHGGAGSHLAAMYNQAYDEYLHYKLHRQLTEEELAFIQASPAVPLGLDPDNYPYSFYDRREGSWAGASLEILDELSRLTGLSFERANDENAQWPDIRRMLVDGEIALVPKLNQIPENSDLFLWLKTAEMTDRYALISHSSYPDINTNEVLHTRVGLVSDTSYAAVFRRWYPDHTSTIEFRTMEAAFESLRNGEIDMVMANQSRLLYLIHYLEYPDYKVNLLFNYTADIQFALAKDQVVLHSILDKAISLVDTEGITDRWMRKTYDYRTRLAEERLPLLISMSVLLAGVLALVVLLWFKTRRSRENAEKVIEERTRELSLRTATLTTLFDSIPDLIYIKDLNLRYVECNKSLQEYFGKTREEIIGTADIGFESLYGNDNNKKALENGETLAFEEFVPRADGALLLHETIQTPLIQGGAVIGVLGIARNINDRKEMEEAALAASRSKTVFLANMSHEIRTPMDSIVGFSELALMDGNISQETRDHMEKILQNSGWLLQTIDNVLDMSKIDSGKMGFEHMPLDITGIFAACDVAIAPEADEKGLIVHIEAKPPQDRQLYGDPGRLCQVLQNLLSNAVKFTDNGMVKMNASVAGEDESSVTMHFEVRDSGVGIARNEIEHIFEPFSQAGSGTKRKHGGSGLGLALAKTIVEQMGGSLDVESIPGVGSKFSFELTFDTTPEPQSPDSRS